MNDIGILAFLHLVFYTTLAEYTMSITLVDPA